MSFEFSYFGPELPLVGMLLVLMLLVSQVVTASAGRSRARRGRDGDPRHPARHRDARPGRSAAQLLLVDGRLALRRPEPARAGRGYRHRHGAPARPAAAGTRGSGARGPAAPVRRPESRHRRARSGPRPDGRGGPRRRNVADRDAGDGRHAGPAGDARGARRPLRRGAEGRRRRPRETARRHSRASCPRPCCSSWGSPRSGAPCWRVTAAACTASGTGSRPRCTRCWSAW